MRHCFFSSVLKQRSALFYESLLNRPLWEYILWNKQLYSELVSLCFTIVLTVLNLLNSFPCCAKRQHYMNANEKTTTTATTKNKTLKRQWRKYKCSITSIKKFSIFVFLFIQFFRDVAWERDILSLRVKCKMNERGCDWMGELRHYEVI